MKGVLTALAQEYADMLTRLNLEIDQAVFNPARMTKLYGTMARKGDNAPDRPHRLARILSLPKERRPVPVELLWKIAQKAITEEPPKTRSNPGPSSSHFDLEGYLAHYGVEVVRVKSHGGGMLYCLEHCLFDPSHTAGESAIGQAADGTLFYQCFHASCQNRTWGDARRIISGDAKLDAFTTRSCQDHISDKASKPDKPADGQ